MVFSLRIDLESDKGIKEGLPRILNLLRKYGIKASFYLVMGGESNLFDILKYRRNLPGERKIKVFSKKELIRMVILPRDFVKENRKLLNRILEEGHELGIHGWKHRAWTRGLEKINIERQINLSVKRYYSFFGIKPISFCSPAFRINKKVVDILDKKGFKVISDLKGDKPFKIKDTEIINVPVTIKGKNNTPIIEYLTCQGFSDEEILGYLLKEIKKKKLATMYIHGMFECIRKIDLLNNLFGNIKRKKIPIKTIKELGLKNENTPHNK